MSILQYDSTKNNRVRMNIPPLVRPCRSQLNPKLTLKTTLVVLDLNPKLL